MSGAIYQAAAGALLQQMRLEMLSNNIANANTSGYKAEVPLFRLPQEAPQAEQGLRGRQGRSITPPMEGITDFSPGAATRTENPLDVAIIGKGFFEIETAAGLRYTRCGSFSIDAEGVLCTALGEPVMGQSGEIMIDGSRVDIGEGGEIYVDGEEVDILKVVDFPEPYELQKTGDTSFAPLVAGLETVLDEGFHIAQGMVEGSNVNTIRNMTDMIETMRVFEAYQKIIKSNDETLRRTVNEIAATA